MRILLALACLLLARQVGADPLKSPACGAALQALEAARGGASAETESMRQQAAKLCLGLNEPAAPRSPRWAQPPISVPAPIIEPPGRPAAGIVPQPLPPAVQVGRQPSITSCDAHGCWADDGTRLQRIVPGSVGPSGLCTVQGGLAFCQ